MSLRSRIGLVFLVLVVLLLALGVLAVRNNHRVGHLAQELRIGSVLDVGYGDLVGAGVEIQGTWDPRGGFLADAILRLPEPRRPKLRGRVEKVDLDRRVLRMYGVDVHVRDDTEFLTPGNSGLKALRAGDRIELSTRADAAGRWIARKISRVNVKDSDKIKGTVTWAHIDRAGFDSLTVSGIPVRFENEHHPGSGPLARLTQAAQLEFALLEMRAAASELLHPDPAHSGTDATNEERPYDQPPLGPRVRLRRAVVAVREQTMRIAGPAADTEVTAWTVELQACLPRLAASTDRFMGAAHPDSARRILEEELDPFIASDLLPLVYALRGNAQEDLEDDIRGIEAEAASTNRLLVTSGLLAVLLALLLTTVVWRSVASRVRVLHDAAQAIAQARFDTRVPVVGTDELAVLGTAFNTMAEKLAESTVSLRQLKGVLDSMAAPLMLVDARGRITQANRAAARLLGYESSEFLGKTWSELQARDGGAPPACDRDSLLAAGDNLLRHRDGSLVPVSFAAAALGGSTASGFVYVALDRTAARQAEDRLQRSLHEKELLLREVHHRVKNNLQVISSLLDLQSRSTAGGAALFEESQNRIRTMALIHEQLCRGAGLDRVDVGAYLDRLVRHVISSSSCSASVRAVVHAEPVELDVDRAMTCGLIVNELVSNALKHAFVARESGEIQVRLAAKDGYLALVVQDDGRGFPGGFDPENPPSLGMTLVGMLVRQLGGRYTIVSSPGCRVEITVAMPEAVSVPERVVAG